MQFMGVGSSRLRRPLPRREVATSKEDKQKINGLMPAA